MLISGHRQIESAPEIPVRGAPESSLPSSKSAPALISRGDEEGEDDLEGSSSQITMKQTLARPNMITIRISRLRHRQTTKGKAITEFSDTIRLAADTKFDDLSSLLQRQDRGQQVPACSEMQR